MIYVSFHPAAMGRPDLEAEDREAQTWQEIYTWMQGHMDIAKHIPRIIDERAGMFQARPVPCTRNAQPVWKFSCSEDLEFLLLCLPPKIQYRIVE